MRMEGGEANAVNGEVSEERKEEEVLEESERGERGGL